ncbi:MAG: bifunctional DNA-formamidopyrimidine glycosylase/DNA-(apurinic or apyrimidinic site) lyase [Bdellovibrionota bacterium]
MPELPEVEAVTRGLANILKSGAEITTIEILSPKLRKIIPIKIKKDLTGQKLISMRRRAKYILFELESWTLISHLGMTGSWRQASLKEAQGVHDHFAISFKGGVRLVYNDPRRFGVIDYSKNDQLDKNQWLKHLGVEPLEEEFTAEYLKTKAKNKKTSVKAFIMDQRNVVGVGNIYASEALYLAQIKPKRTTSRVSLAEWAVLVQAIKTTLRKSIDSGGTTLKDYRQVSGEKGGFQTQLLIYDRKGEKCYRCTKNKLNSTVRAAVIVGRSTYWCNTCQK